MEQMLSVQPESPEPLRSACTDANGGFHARLGEGNSHAHKDDILLARLAEGSAAPKQAMASWQGGLSRLGSELAKVVNLHVS